MKLCMPCPNFISSLLPKKNDLFEPSPGGQDLSARAQASVGSSTVSSMRDSRSSGALSVESTRSIRSEPVPIPYRSSLFSDSAELSAHYEEMEELLRHREAYNRVMNMYSLIETIETSIPCNRLRAFTSM